MTAAAEYLAAAPSAPWVVLDLEYDGQPYDGRLLCVGLDDTALDADLPEDARVMLADPSVVKVTFTKADHRWLRLAGYTVDGPVHDVQVMAWLLDEAQDLDLESVALRYCDIKMDKRISSRAGLPVFRCDDGLVVPLGEAPRDQVFAYNERDLSTTVALYLDLWQRLADAGLLEHFLNEQVPFTSELLGMEVRGIPVDIDATRALRQELSGEIATLDAELHETANLPDAFNLNSSTQLADYLFSKRFVLKGRFDVPASVRDIPKDERVAAMQKKAPSRFVVERVGLKYAHGHYDLAGLGLKVHAKTDSGAPSTAAPKLRTFYGDREWIAKYLEMKQRSTVVGFLTSYEELAHDGRLYGTFKQTGTATGRLSSASPNMQNVPARTDLGKRVRGLIRFSDCYGIHADYSQLEPRLMAHWSQDLVLLDIFRTGKDIYRVTAAYIFGVDIDDVTPTQRGICKTLILALGYGAGAAKVAMILSENGYPTNETTAGGYLKELKQLYRVFFGWKEDVIRGAGAVGYVSTLAGRKRRLASGEDRGATGDHWKNAELSETQAANAVIQGSAADIVQRVMVRAGRDLPHFGLIAQVHDELLWECEQPPAPFHLLKLQKIAETGHGFKLSVPLVFEPRLVSSWAEGKD